MLSISSLFNTNARKFASIFAKNQLREDLEFDFSDSDLSTDPIYVDVETRNDLPQLGRSDLTYRTLSDMQLWKWQRNAYHSHNPYTFGITQEFNDVEREIIVMSNNAVLDENNKRLVLQDEQQLPAISIDAIREGADARLAVGYNIEALRHDLRVITALKISFNTMMKEGQTGPYYKSTQKQNLIDNWFYHNHQALHLLLRSTCRSANHLDNNMLDGINLKGAHLWWDAKSGNARFKDGEFEVNL